MEIVEGRGVFGRFMGFHALSTRVEGGCEFMGAGPPLSHGGTKRGALPRVWPEQGRKEGRAMAHEVMVEPEGARFEGGELKGVKVRSTFSTRIGKESVRFEVVVDLDGIPMEVLFPKAMAQFVVMAQKKQVKYSREEASEMWSGELGWEEFLGTHSRPSAAALLQNLSVEDLERLLARKLQEG